MNSDRLPVGKLAEQAGCQVETVRYYEKVGLMPEPPRSEGGHRVYSRTHLRRLYFIRRSRELGFPVAQVRQLLQLVDEPEHTCDEVRALTLQQAAQLQRKIDDLTRLQQALTEMARQCSGGTYTIADCPIIDVLCDTEAD